MSIRIENVSKQFNQTRVLSPLTLDIHEGEMLALLGPSGSGKTTLLRMIAGLESCEQGSIFFGKRNVTKVHVRDRKIGFVFQHYALFQHMSVADNIAFGLTVLPRKLRPNKQAIAEKADTLLEMIKLSHLKARYPSQLSGGQKQRVALARALATEPDVLLLDEPFGALDAQVRKDLRHWLRRLHEELKFTSIFVTHDQEEAFEVSDRVAILNNGNIEQIDTPTALFASPANRFVFDFLGHVNSFEGVISEKKLQCNDAFFNLPEHQPTRKGCLYFRSHEIQACTDVHHTNNLKCTVQSVSPVGAEIRIELEGINFTMSEPWELTLSHTEQSHLNLEKGHTCYLKPRVGHFFKEGDSTPSNIHWPSTQQPQLSMVNETS